MNSLELKSIVKRLHTGQCPVCLSNLAFIANTCDMGTLEKNGMVDVINFSNGRFVVYCDTCGYKSNAVQLGLKLIPVDRIVEFDEKWDVPYLEDNTLIYGEKGKNPFNKEDKE